MEQTTVASGGGNPEKLTANGKERAVITKVGKRSDLGWESRGWKFTQEELANPPSLRDNMNDSEEKEYRRKAHTFIYDCCQVLRAKALVIAAAMTISQRYFSQVSFRKIDRSDTAAAAIFLASKVEEFRVHIKDVMMVTHRVRHKNQRRLVENSDVSTMDTGLFVQVVLLLHHSLSCAVIFSLQQDCTAPKYTQ
ncbi:unnamed protein product [Ectocarpus sp. CCAP 1310/34]|nr:unnamed protein product [Ectocarpus sp. CCAP 1310/34]